MGNSRSFRRRLKANQPTALEKRLQKTMRKRSHTNVKIRLGTVTEGGPGGNTDPDEVKTT
jgi:hypothetical protein